MSGAKGAVRVLVALALAALIGGALSALAADQDGQGAAPTRIADCADIPDKDARLACYKIAPTAPASTAVQEPGPSTRPTKRAAKPKAAQSKTRAKPTATQPQASKLPAAPDDRWSYIYDCKRQIERDLNDPKSAEWPEGNRAYYEVDKSGQLVIQMALRAKNAFGGKVLTTVECRFVQIKGKWTFVLGSQI